MRELVANPDLVARCGLYCGACGAFLKERCPGCRDNPKAGWCKVRSCCLERDLASCADCQEHPDPATCRHFDNVFSRLMGVLLNSDRRACVLRIRSLGRGPYAELMAGRRARTVPRRGGQPADAGPVSGRPS